MNVRRLIFLTGCPILASLLAVTAVQVEADTVYKYVDHKGAVTFSDTPPAHSAEYEELTVRNPAPSDPETHRAAMEQITETSNRLQADRLAREKTRELVRPTPAPVVHYPEPEYNRGIYLNPGYPDYRHRPRPHPPYRLDSSRDSMDDKLRTPIRIPAFGSGDSLRDR